MQRNLFDRTCLVFIIVGALNWLFVGLFQYDLVAAILGGSSSLLSRTIYSLVGLAGLFAISLLFRNISAVEESSQL